MKKILTSIIIFLIAQFNTVFSCELTDPYKKARIEVGRMVFGENNDYMRCKNTAHKNEYWRALSKCLNKGDGKNIGGGCAHLVMRGEYINKPDLGHCEAFKFEPSKEMAKLLLEEMVKERGIKKCVK
ncbi:MAG: hypothetical protein OEZ39_16290 [Gammaproteobacteria bacterium]|nr:hypothetical protein [Gammaproteobacteria bacterium]MDH5653419.1 hypothetical protein [Gammaproteobacteria bacterium]